MHCDIKDKKQQVKMVTLYLQYFTIVSQKRFAPQYRQRFLNKGIEQPRVRINKLYHNEHC